jgi:transposase
MNIGSRKISSLFSSRELSHENAVATFSENGFIESLLWLAGQIVERNNLMAEQDLLIAKLTEEVADKEIHITEQAKEITQLKALVAELESKLTKAKKNSSTSSKPPSSDIVKPGRTPKTGNNEKRSKGGQKGHPRHERLPFTEEEINDVHEYTIDTCPDCGSSLCSAEEAPRVIQQVEIVERPIRIDEHRGLAYWCDHCQKVHYAPFPPMVEKGGLFGPRLSAQVAYQKSAGHASFTTIQKYLRDVLGISVSRGYLTKIVQKVRQALQNPYDELLKRLPSESWLNVDETGHKENGDRFWTWCFRAETYVLFKIAGSRGSQILFDVLGKEFAGILGCDYFSAYRKYMKDCDIYVQFCLAHLIRDLKYLMTLSDVATVAYGENLLKYIREMFAIIHRRHSMDQETFQAVLATRREEILVIGTSNIPQTKEAQNLAKRFRLHGDSYFRFITTPCIEPTNNLAEQAIRFVVIDRLITQGTRSRLGREWCQYIWTVLATCANQSRSAFDFLYQAIHANFTGQTAPSLLATPP